MRTDRDRRLGEVLRRLAAPAHRDGFFDAVWGDIGTAAGGASVGRPEHRSLWSLLVQAPRRPRLALAAVVIASVVAAVVLFGPPADKHADMRLSGGSTAQGPIFSGPEPAGAETAAQIMRTVERTLRSAHVITADTASWLGDPGDEPRFIYRTHIVLAADRSSRATVSDATGSYTGAYDARTGAEHVWGWGADPDGPSVDFFMEEYVGIPPGEPDGDWLPVGDDLAAFRSPTNAAGGQLFAAIARVARTDPDATARTGSFAGRPVWIVSCRVTPKPQPGDRLGQRTPAAGRTDPIDHELLVSVDRRTGLPVRVQSLVDGELVAEGRMGNVKLDPPVAAGTFTMGLPAAAEVKRGGDGRLYLWVDLGGQTAVEPLPFDAQTVDPDDVRISIPDAPNLQEDHGFRRMPLDRVAAATEREALIPTWLPRGFRLDQVAVKQEQRASGDSGAVGRALAGASIVMVRYTNGFQKITVSTRELDPGVTSERFSLRTDPFIGSAWPGREDAREAVRIRGGAFSGAEGAVVIAPLTIPHLWAVKDGMLLTVDGDASAKQLLRIAESIQAWTPANGSDLSRDHSSSE